jgi:Protein of unknown function (DUF2844)
LDFPSARLNAGLGMVADTYMATVVYTMGGWRRSQVVLATLLVVFGTNIFASASLGGDLGSVHRDSIHVNVIPQTTNAERYTIYEMRISTGTHVREFISPSGVVFGVAWQGPFVPELQQFLGAYYYREYSVAIQSQKSNPFSRKPVHLRLADLAFENGGRVGAFYGRAYIPQAIPPAVAIAEIH